MRPSQRTTDQLRNIRFTRQFTKYAEGSVLVEFGETKVICTASITQGVPPFLKDSGEGWLTAEYGMLPRATDKRNPREAAKGKQSGRTQEIQRLIGRSLRSCVNLKSLGEYTIAVDCDVIQADGGTRTATITGGAVAVYDALTQLKQRKSTNVLFKQFVAAVSVGIYKGKPILDLDYLEDVAADTDMNVVMNENGHFIEIQGTAEKNDFQLNQLNELLALAQDGIAELIKKQREIVGLS